MAFVESVQSSEVLTAFCHIALCCICFRCITAFRWSFNTHSNLIFLARVQCHGLLILVNVHMWRCFLSLYRVLYVQFICNQHHMTALCMFFFYVKWIVIGIILLHVKWSILHFQCFVLDNLVASMYNVAFIEWCMCEDHPARAQQETDTPGISHQAHRPRDTGLPKVGQKRREHQPETVDGHCE